MNTIEDILDSAVNVAEIITDEELVKIGKAVVEGYDNDYDSREEWQDRNDDAMKLALQVVEAKTKPWQGAANVKYPLLTTAALQFSSRAYPALIPGTNIVKGRVVGYDKDGSKLERATRIGKHMSYQLLEKMEDWEEEMDKLCLTLPILGCVFKKTYFNPVKGVNVSEVIYPKDLVINYYSPTIEKSERITHVIQLTDNDIYERKASGLFLDVDINKTSIEADEADTDRGLTEPSADDDTLPYNILEQHCLLDLDDDGYKEPYIVTVHEDSAQVLRIIPRYTVESIETDDEANVVRIEPTQYFTKYGFIPSPDGSIYDLGFGTLLGPMNDTINTLINQLLDAGTISNLGGGFISKGVRVRGGNKEFVPGEWKTVDTYGDDLRKGIVPLPVREPSNTLFTLLDTMVSSGERLSSVTEMMSGEIPGQNTKATVALAAIEQGMKVFNAIYKRIYRSMKKEFRKLYALNKEHLELEEYFTVLDIGQETESTISVIDYRLDSSDVIPYADPSVATEEQKLAKISALSEVLELGHINPMEYTRRFLEATDQPNVEQLMEMPQRQPDPAQELEKFKVQDESAREWRRLEIDAMIAMSKISKEEVDSIVALSTAKQAEVKDAVDAIQEEAKIELARGKSNEQQAGRNAGNSTGVGKPSDNT